MTKSSSKKITSCFYTPFLQTILLFSARIIYLPNFLCCNINLSYYNKLLLTNPSE